MQEFLRFSRQGFEVLRPYPYLQAALIIIVFSGLAKLIDRVLGGLITRLVSNTKTHLDDQRVEIVRRPVFTTVAMIGLVLATYRLDFRPELRTTTISVIQTLLAVIWLLFGLRVSRLLLAAMKRQQRRTRSVN